VASRWLATEGKVRCVHCMFKSSRGIKLILQNSFTNQQQQSSSLN